VVARKVLEIGDDGLVAGCGHGGLVQGNLHGRSVPGGAIYPPSTEWKIWVLGAFLAAAIGAVGLLLAR
jgi:hypothetical protein